MNKTWLVVDPGVKKFALTVIHKGRVAWMGYHPTAESFEVNNISYFDAFQVVSGTILNKCDVLFIERYVARQANAKVSGEKLNLMIGGLITLARNDGKEVIAKTSSTWKRTYKYDKCIEYSVKIGFLKKDKHFVDTVLMWCYAQGRQESYRKFLRLSLPAYKYTKELEVWNKWFDKLPKAKKIEALKKMWRIKSLIEGGNQWVINKVSKKLALRLCLVLANRKNVYC